MGKVRSFQDERKDEDEVRKVIREKVASLRDEGRATEKRRCNT